MILIPDSTESHKRIGIGSECWFSFVGRAKRIASSVIRITASIVNYYPHVRRGSNNKIAIYFSCKTERRCLHRNSFPHVTSCCARVLSLFFYLLFHKSNYCGNILVLLHFNDHGRKLLKIKLRGMNAVNVDECGTFSCQIQLW